MNNTDLALKAVENLYDQSLQAWSEVSLLKFPKDYEKLNNIVVSGMGGSTLSTHILKSLYKFNVPIEIVEDYHLPEWADESTFVLLSSYSGNTEETLSCGHDALKNHCKITGICIGGLLQEFLNKNNLPAYVVDPKFNLGNMPRFALGYSIFSQLGIFYKLGYISDLSKEMYDQLPTKIKNLKLNNDALKVSAEKLAAKIKDKIFCVITGEHLSGNGKTFVNQLNETSKVIAFCTYLPDGDHSKIEGFSSHVDNLFIFMMDSKNYSEKILKRFDITKDVINTLGYYVFNYESTLKDKFEEMLESLVFTSYLTVNAAIEKNIDPLSIPAIDKIKSLV